MRAPLASDLSISSQSLTITLKDRLYNKEVVIRPISAYKTYRSLGTEQGISKNQTQQHVKLTKTSDTHQRKLACSANICGFDGKEGFYKVKYRDGDIEEGDETDIAKILKPPNKTSWKQALAATRFERVQARYCKLDRKSTRLNSSHASKSRMPSSA